MARCPRGYLRRPRGGVGDPAGNVLKAEIVHTPSPEPDRADQVGGEQPDTPKVGRWYWVKDVPDEGEVAKAHALACVTKLGSNYVELTHVAGEAQERIHDDRFWSRCEFVEDPDSLLRGNAERCRRELDGLMEDVKLLTSKLGVAPSLALGTGGEVAALALRTNEPTDAYKTALVKAKDETLPELFEKIKGKSEEYKHWLTAQVIPMKAEARALKPVIRRVEDRIFSVELFCLGSRGVHVKFTHYTRRNLATKARGDLVRASRNESRRAGA